MLLRLRVTAHSKSLHNRFVHSVITSDLQVLNRSTPTELPFTAWIYMEFKSLPQFHPGQILPALTMDIWSNFFLPVDRVNEQGHHWELRDQFYRQHMRAPSTGITVRKQLILQTVHDTYPQIIELWETVRGGKEFKLLIFTVYWQLAMCCCTCKRIWPSPSWSPGQLQSYDGVLSEKSSGFWRVLDYMRNFNQKKNHKQKLAIIAIS